MNLRIALLFAILVFASSQGVAQSWTFPDATVEYGGHVKLDPNMYCKPSGKCPASPVLNMCGKSLQLEGYVESSWPINYDDDDGVTNEYHYKLHSTGSKKLKVPKHVPCSPASTKRFHIYDSYDDEAFSGGSLSVVPKNMEAHKGDYIFLELDVDQNDLRDFLLTNDGQGLADAPHNDLSMPDKGAIIIEETDWKSGDGVDDFGYYNPQVGEVIKVSSDSLSNLNFNGKKLDGAHGAWVGEDGKGAQDVWEYPMGNGIGRFLGYHNGGCDADVDDLGSCTPVSDQGAYKVEGDIIKAYEPDYYKDKQKVNGKDHPRWFVCRAGAMMPDGNGDQTRQVVSTSNDGSQQSYKCNMATGSWEKTYECSDGLDNDGDKKIDGNDASCVGRGDTWDNEGASTVPACDDGDNNDPSQDSKIDYPDDPGCDSPEDPLEWESCPPKIQLDSDGKKYADYDGAWVTSNSGLGGYCQYGSKDYNLLHQGDSPEVFFCNTDKNIADLNPSNAEDSYDGINPFEASQYCRNGVEIQDSIGTFFQGHGAYMPVVEYYVPKTAIPLGSNGWATRSGFAANNRYQSLTEAEKKYDGGSSDFLCDDCHLRSTWSQKGLVETTASANGGDGYSLLMESDSPSYMDEPEAPDQLDSWIVANTTGQSEPKVYTTPGTYDITSGWYFRGGFAGKCSGGEVWERVNTGSARFPDYDWRCTGEINFNIPVYNPDIRYTGGSATIGFYLMPFTFRSSASSVPNRLRSAPKKVRAFSEPTQYQGDWNNNPPEITGIHARCYPSTPPYNPSSFPSSEKGKTWTSIDITGIDYSSIDRPVPVFGNISQMQQNTTHKCEWKFKLDTTGDGSGDTWRGDIGNAVNMTTENYGNVMSTYGLPSSPVDGLEFFNKSKALKKGLENKNALSMTRQSLDSVFS